MLLFDSVAVRRGARRLFAEFSTQIHAGEKLGIVGANGAGKSSLLALLSGELETDAGLLERPAGWIVATVEQEPPASDRSALELTKDGDSEFRRLEREIAAADGAHQAELLARFEAIGGYSSDARAARLLAGLGFDEPRQRVPLHELSGGWRRRVALARALMARADLLLLDEPTNHLDLDAVLWLEQWLAGFPGTLLVISHDRDFLDSCVGRILYIDDGRIESFQGNYSAAERQRAQHAEFAAAERRKRQREVEHILRFVERFRAKASKARQVQSRLKRLERLPQIAPAQKLAAFRFAFQPPARLPHPLLVLENATLGYRHAVIEQVGCTLAPGERIGVLGRNGAGKSTLMKSLAGLLPPLGGERQPADGLAVGYFAQHQLEQLEPDASPMQHLRRLAVDDAAEQALREHLAAFGFYGERVFDPVEPYSLGEKVRLVLALLVYQRPNLLLLDEPANHLDMDTRHALALALQDFDGALLMVSHDRFLLESCVDRFWLLADGRLAPFDGDLEDYVAWLQRNRRAAATTSTGRLGPTDRREQRRVDARRRAELKPLRDEVQRLEQALQHAESERAQIERQLADPELYRADGNERISGLARRRAELQGQIDALEERWLAASERLESAAEARRSATDRG